MELTVGIRSPESQSLKKSILQKVYSGRALGYLEHPADGKQSLSLAAFIVKSIIFDGRGSAVISTVDSPGGRYVVEMAARGHLMDLIFLYRRDFPFNRWSFWGSGFTDSLVSISMEF